MFIVAAHLRPSGAKRALVKASNVHTRHVAGEKVHRRKGRCAKKAQEPPKKRYSEEEETLVCFELFASTTPHYQLRSAASRPVATHIARSGPLLQILPLEGPTAWPT